MQQTFSTFEMKKWISNFNNNEQLPFITRSALINLKELEDFIAAIKAQQADAVRVYFLRFGQNDAPTPPLIVNGKVAAGCKWHNASPDLTQATIALIPVKNFRHDEEFVFSADNIINNNQVLALLPGTVGEGTGLNPPAGATDDLDKP